MSVVKKTLLHLITKEKLGDEHMNGAAKKKRKVVVGEKVEKEKRKVVDVKVFLLRRERKSKEDNPYVALVHGKRSTSPQGFKRFCRGTTVHVLESFLCRKFCNELPPKDWVDKIHEERRILAENLPETIYVRVYEDRVDLLTAVIIGPQGTPYQNGLYFFDVCFPSNYPVSPPLVHYRSGDLGINPNLYKCGKTMVYTMKNPPKNFEVFVDVHFENYLGDIIIACNKETGSVTFKNDLDSCIKQVVAAVNKMGPTKT
nr:hypothetical protein [Tanacetum cinerariifolium]